MPSKLHGAIHRDWGLHYKRQNELRKAIKSFQDSVQSNTELFRSYLENSICQLQINQPAEALEFAKKCLELNPKSIEAKHAHANALYELNFLETAMKSAWDTFAAHPKDHIGTRFVETAHLNLTRATGSGAGRLLRRFNYEFSKGSDDDIAEKEDRKVVDDCDVMSLKGDTKGVEKPFEKHRKQTRIMLRHEIYFDSSVKEHIVFWNQLKSHPAINLVQTPESSRILVDTINQCLSRVHEYEEMLYNRDPLFSKRRIANENITFRQISFFYLQQNTRSQALAQLEKLKKLAETNFKQMLEYVETIMLDFLCNQILWNISKEI